MEGGERGGGEVCDVWDEMFVCVCVCMCVDM